jgi:hypothetical protein
LLVRGEQLFLKQDDQNLLTLILNIFNILLQHPQQYRILKDKYTMIKRIFDIMINENKAKALKSAALLAAANITYNENSFEKYSLFINIDYFFSLLKSIYLDLDNQIDKEYLINIFTNLAFIREFHPFIIKYQKNLSIITDIFNSETDRTNNILTLALNFLVNISHNSDFHSFISCEEIMRVLSSLYCEPTTDVKTKHLIKKILANTTFSYATHLNIIKHKGLEILSLNPMDEDHAHSGEEKPSTKTM